MGELADDFAHMKEQRQKHKDAVTPDRMEFALKLLRDSGYTADASDHQTITVYWKGGYVTLWAYTGWWSGKGIGSGRGIKNLVDKLNHKNY